MLRVEREDSTIRSHRGLGGEGGGLTGIFVLSFYQFYSQIQAVFVWLLPCFPVPFLQVSYSLFYKVRTAFTVFKRQ